MDLETDSKIQQTIQTEFGDRTLICIARKSILIMCHTNEIHWYTPIDRLRTILSYDRILVLDGGQIAVSSLSNILVTILNSEMLSGVRHTLKSL